MSTTRYSCPSCGAALVFGAGSQQLECESCGNKFPLETVEQYEKNQVEDNTSSMEWEKNCQDYSDEELKNLHMFRCQTCGAQIVCEKDLASTECVYCGNPTVMPEVLEGNYRPDYVIPFQKTKDEAIAALKRFYEGKTLLPGSFAKSNRVESITGVYVPVWLYSCDSDGDMTMKACKDRIYRRGDYQITETAHYLVRRSGNVQFQYIPVNGSTRFEDPLMESIEPFEMNQHENFSTVYLSGFQAQRYDQDAAACQGRANERIVNSIKDLLRNTVHGYTRVEPGKANIHMYNQIVHQVLMPVWLLNTSWKNKMYTFAMNGQTGKVTGNLPVSVGKAFAWFVGIFAVLAGVGLFIVKNAV